MASILLGDTIRPRRVVYGTLGGGKESLRKTEIVVRRASCKR